MGMRLLPLLALALGLLSHVAPTTSSPDHSAKNVRGVVFHDANADGLKNNGERGIPNVQVSNGWQVTSTNKHGKWQLEIPTPDEFGQRFEIFVIKPRDWMTPLDENLNPNYYYVHRPNGSPTEHQYSGSSASGKLPKSINFPLVPQAEGDELRVLMYGDPQPRNLTEVAWMKQDVVEECRDFDGAFGMALGDIAFNDLSILPNVAAALAESGVPWWMVLGNHDINFDAANDSLANETFIANFGPANYAFNWGPVHFLVLDDVDWVIPEEITAEQGAHYEARFSEQALEFARNDLALVPKDKLVVAAMHIPLRGVENSAGLLELLGEFKHSVSVSGHTHTQRVDELGEQHGWPKEENHSHVVHVTACGSWWTGQPDERGIPHTLMRDGSPNGWLEWTFNDGEWMFDFRAAGMEPEKQMHVLVGEPTHEPPNSLQRFRFDQQLLPIWVNVWNGDTRNKVEMRFNSSSEWLKLGRIDQVDPIYAKLFKEEEKIRGERWLKMPEPQSSTHLWFGNFAFPDIWDGPSTIEIRVTDRWGRRFTELVSF